MAYHGVDDIRRGADFDSSATYLYGFKAVTNEYTPGKGICLAEVKPAEARNSTVSSPETTPPEPPKKTAATKLSKAILGDVSV